jgi:hypothetical protein
MHKANEEKIFFGIKHETKNTTVIRSIIYLSSAMRITNIGGG